MRYPVLLPALLALTLVGCGHTPPTFVECKGVSTIGGKPLYTEKGTCEKLAGGTPVVLPCSQWTLKDRTFICANSSMTIPNYTPDDYVKCYAVAAASMNDCGTTSSACGGTMKIARDPSAWIAIPGGICSQIKGGILAKNTG